MTEPFDIEPGLRAAREVFAPSAAQRERVRLGLAARAAPAASGEGELSSATRALSARRSPLAGSSVKLAPGPLLSLVKAGALLGAGFVLGYWFADTRHAQPPLALPPGVMAAASAPDVPLTAESAASNRVTVSEERPATGAAPSDDDRERGSGAAPGERARQGAASTVAARAAPRAHAARARVPTVSAEELGWLQRAERAIRAGDGALARSFIHELTTRFPSTTWSEERDAILVLAACTLGEPDAKQNARTFLRRRANSVYLDRVTELCRLDASERSARPPVNGSPKPGH